MSLEAKHETAVAAARVAPAIGGTVYTALTLNDIVAIATIIYVLLQIGLLLPKYWAGIKAWKAKRNG